MPERDDRRYYFVAGIGRSDNLKRALQYMPLVKDGANFWVTEPLDEITPEQVGLALDVAKTAFRWCLEDPKSAELRLSPRSPLPFPGVLVIVADQKTIDELAADPKIAPFINDVSGRHTPVKVAA